MKRTLDEHDNAGEVKGKEVEYGAIDIMELVALLLIPTCLKAQKQQNTQKDEAPTPLLHSPPSNLVESVLSKILEDVTGTSDPKTLTADLLRDIFSFYGERELAENNDLMEEMVGSASVTGSEKPVMLDSYLFTNSLAKDVMLLNVTNETRLSSHFDDSTLNVASSDKITKGNDLEKYKRNMFPAIDFTAGTFRSHPLAVVVWIVTLLAYFSYFLDFAQDGIPTVCDEEDAVYVWNKRAPWRANRTAIGCNIGQGIVFWNLLFIILTLFGMLTVSFGSLGNSSGDTKWWIHLVGAASIFVISGAGYFALGDGHRQIKFFWSTFVLGCLGTILHLLDAIASVLNKPKVPESSTLKLEKTAKAACSHKLSNMVENALEVTNDQSTMTNQSNYFRSISNYDRLGVRYMEVIGGYRWTSRQIASGDIFTKEGMWCSLRLFSMNLLQWLVVFFILVEGIILFVQVYEDYDPDNATLEVKRILQHVVPTTVNEGAAALAATGVTGVAANFLRESINLNCSATDNAQNVIANACVSVEGERFLQCDGANVNDLLCAATLNTGDLSAEEQFALLNASGFGGDELINMTMSALQAASDSTLENFFPSSRYMVTVPLGIGVTVAVLSAAYQAATYAANLTSIVFRLRCGVIPTLDNPEVLRWKGYPDKIAWLTGTVFWGALGSSILLGGLVALVVFLFLWQGSVFFAQLFLAAIVGVFVVSSGRFLVVSFCRVRVYVSLFRKRPLVANLLLVAQEWAYFGISVGVVLYRVLFVLGTALLSVGRADRRILHNEVNNFLGFEIDYLPTYQLRNLLISEAHSHPYLQLLGSIYLLKIQYPDNFATVAGSKWRLLFVYGLMPWLSKYRMATRLTGSPSLELTIGKRHNNNNNNNSEEGKSTHHPLVSRSHHSESVESLQLEVAELRASLAAAQAELKSLKETEFEAVKKGAEFEA